MNKASVWASEFSPEQRVFQWFYMFNENVCNFPTDLWEKNFKIHGVAEGFNAHFYAQQFGEFNVTSVRSTPWKIGCSGLPETHSLPARRFLVFQRKGSIQYVQNNKMITLQPGDWGLFNLGVETEVLLHEDVHLIMMTFPASQIDSILSLVEMQLPFRFDSTREKKSQLFYNSALTLMCDELTYGAETGERILQALIYLLEETIESYSIVPFDLAKSKNSHYRDLSIQYLSAHLDDMSFSVSKMAKALRFSVRTLNRVMRDVHGESVEKLLWKMRLEQASQALKLRSNDRLSLTDIAYSCGFSSASHFCRKFKECWGVTPSQFRMQHRC
ncbi:helix-turn-helix domain-containing protein [Pseudomonas cichorii]|uniref:helix-turn-helix domain-containing protein n=1 Tax=Pseudomonas cichorii TaxID=36746 RepID=UPI001910A1D8|nr:helix-turn-helix domain-containing protein [Pseudomonas cichorii]